MVRAGVPGIVLRLFGTREVEVYVGGGWDIASEVYVGGVGGRCRWEVEVGGGGGV